MQFEAFQHSGTHHQLVSKIQGIFLSLMLLETSLAAVSIADERGCREIRTEHLLLAMMLEPTCHAAILLAENGADIERMKLVTAGVNCNEAQRGSDLSLEALRAFLQ
jgi:hypothetical protein